MLFLPAWISLTMQPLFTGGCPVCPEMYWKTSVLIERIPCCAVSVHQETQGLHLPTAFPKRKPLRPLNAWKDTGELAIMRL